MAKCWYVVQARSGYEAKAKRSLEERIKLNNCEDKFEEILVPTEELVEMRTGQRRKTKHTVLPGYVLVKMEMDEDTWHLVKNVPEVLHFVGGTSSYPTPITEKEANRLLTRMEESSEKPKHKVLFKPGEVIRVIDGPFAEFNGVVEEVSYDKSRLRVSVMIFGRSTPVDLDFGQVEKS